MRRRGVIIGTGAAALASLAASAAPAQVPRPAKPRIVMIHGSWHWGGCFQKVANCLAAMGYPVATPDLTSHGFDDSAYDSFSTIDDYARPAERILQGTTEPVVLVAHSMGGVTATHLAERHPDRIAKLIYLTAFMVPQGKRALDYILLNLDIPAAKELFEAVSRVDDGRGLRLDLGRRDLVKAAFYADCSDHDVEVAARNVLPITSTVPDLTASTITPDRFGRIPRVYIECTADKAIPIETQRLMIRDVPGATVASLPTSHSAFLSQPEALSTLIADHAS